LRLQDSVDKLKAKLIEAASVYRKDKETIDWHVMQDPKVWGLPRPSSQAGTWNQSQAELFPRGFVWL
jgi:hypothetical protein